MIKFSYKIEKDAWWWAKLARDKDLFGMDWEKDNFKYLCRSIQGDSIEEIIGQEQIFQNNKPVYYFYYAGGLLNNFA